MPQASKIWNPDNKGDIYCPLREDPIGWLQQELEKIAGQQNALKIVRAALMRNLKARKGPLVLHIAGPSGVGKSMTARAVATSTMLETKSTNSMEWCGVTILNGHYYSGSTVGFGLGAVFMRTVC